MYEAAQYAPLAPCTSRPSRTGTHPPAILLRESYRQNGRDLQVRPIYHWLEDRVRAHVFLCMLAYYLEWHIRKLLAPLLFDDTDRAAADALRRSVVAPAQRSAAAVTKQTTGVTPDGLPVHSLRTLIADLATLARNTVVTAITPKLPLIVLTRPTAVQRRAFDLLGLTV